MHGRDRISRRIESIAEQTLVLLVKLTNRLDQFGIVAFLVWPTSRRVDSCQSLRRQSDPTTNAVEVLLIVLIPTDVIDEQFVILIGHEFTLRTEQHMSSESRILERSFHRSHGILPHSVIIAVDEAARRDESIKGIANDAELEVAAPHPGVQMTSDLRATQMTVRNRRQCRNRKQPLVEQQALLPVSSV